MALPATPRVQIRLGTGSAFGDVMVLGDLVNGILGSNILGGASVDIIDISDQVQQITVRRGRDRMFAQYTPGTAVVRFVDFTGDWNPENASSPYYGQILPMRMVQISADYSGTGYSLFTGYITSWDWSWQDQAASFAVVTVQCVDAFRLLSLSNVTTVAGAPAGQLPGPRIAALLDAVSWPSQLRNLSTGDTTLQADPGGERTALEAIQLVETSDIGAFFIDGDGKATYLSRLQLAAKAAGTATSFRDDGTAVSYQQLDIDLDDTELSNSVTVQRAGGTPQTEVDTTSINDYFLRSWSLTDQLMDTDLQADLRARSILFYRANPRLRVDSINLDLSSPSNRLVPGLSLDIGDPITVRKEVAGGTTLDIRVVVNGINHDITPDRWRARFSTAYPLSTAFILGSNQFGILGSSTL